MSTCIHVTFDISVLHETGEKKKKLAQQWEIAETKFYANQHYNSNCMYGLTNYTVYN